MPDRTTAQWRPVGPRSEVWPKLRANPLLSSGGVIAILAVVIVGLWLLGLHTAGEDPTTTARFLDSERYRLWLACLSVSVATWALLGVWGTRLHYDPRTTPDVPALPILGAATIFVVIIGVLQSFLLMKLNLVISDEYPLGWWGLGRFVLPLIGLVAAVPWLTMLWRVDAWARKYGPSADVPTRERQWLLIEGSLTAIGIIIVTATASAFMLRFALLAEQLRFAGPYVVPSNFPSYAIIIYGAVFVCVLAIAFLPVALSWRGMLREKNGADHD